MDRSSDRAWTTSLQQHRLGVGNVAYGTWGKLKSQTRLPEANVSDPGQPMDILEWPQDRLAWELALTAQSSAYLALELQAFAERFSEMPIRCAESTYRRLCDSVETLRALLDAIHKNYKQVNDTVSEGYVPVLSDRLVGEIRSMLGQELVSGSGGSTISTARVARNRTADAGDTK